MAKTVHAFGCLSSWAEDLASNRYGEQISYCCEASPTVGKLQSHHGETPVPPREYWSFSIGDFMKYCSPTFLLA